MPCRQSVLLLALALATASPAFAADSFVALDGDDAAPGSAAAPFATINRALRDAMPGDTVHLAPGLYLQDVRSVRDGTAAAPIRIVGPAEAVVSGAGASRIIEIGHDHHVLEGFTVDGRFGAEEAKESYRDKLLYVIGRAPGRGVAGLKVLDMTFRNAGGECIRLRYLVTEAEIAGSTIERCGVWDFAFADGGKNGEGIYIGTAPEQRGRNGAPDGAVDRSDRNWIHDNRIDTRGNECVDIKEGASGNIVERNVCTGQTDPESGGLDARGEQNIFRHNTIIAPVGAGIRFGGDGEADGIGNEAYGNRIIDPAAGGFALQRGPQGRICDNVVTGSERLTFGRFRDAVDPTGPCAAFVWRDRGAKDDND